MVKNECGQFGLWTLKLTISEEWRDGINWFFVFWYKFMQIKKCLKISVGGHGEKWVWLVWWWDSKIDCIRRMNRWSNLFFACWYRFTKIKSWSKIWEWREWPSWKVGGEWPSGLRHCNQNWKVPGSNLTKRSSGLRDPNSLWGSWWPSGWIYKKASIMAQSWLWGSEGIGNWGYWYKFRKVESSFNDFWVGMVKSGYGLLVHEILKSTVS